jgi:CRP-like cAMP-binding protein
MHTHGELIGKIRLFDGKNHEFIWSMVPLFSQMKLFKKDILYTQGDQSQEVFFIIKGRVKFFWKKPITGEETRLLRLKNVYIDPPIAFNTHVEGSYFGDNDVMLDGGRGGRDSTSIAMKNCDLMVIRKKPLEDLLLKFPVYRRQMKATAVKRKYHH